MYKSSNFKTAAEILGIFLKLESVNIYHTQICDTIVFLLPLRLRDLLTTFEVSEVYPSRPCISSSSHFPFHPATIRILLFFFRSLTNGMVFLPTFMFVICQLLRTHFLWYRVFLNNAPSRYLMLSIHFFQASVFRRFRKTARATTSFAMSVCPPAWNSLAPTRRIFMKCYNHFCKIYRENSSVIKIWQK
jgi:hypothetical protein